MEIQNLQTSLGSKQSKHVWCNPPICKGLEDGIAEQIYLGFRGDILRNDALRSLRNTTRVRLVSKICLARLTVGRCVPLVVMVAQGRFPFKLGTEGFWTRLSKDHFWRVFLVRWSSVGDKDKALGCCKFKQVTGLFHTEACMIQGFTAYASWELVSNVNAHAKNQMPIMYMNLNRGFLEQGRISSGTTSRRLPYAIQDLLLHSKRTCGQSEITTAVSRWGNDATYTSLIHAYIKAERVEDATETVNKMMAAEVNNVFAGDVKQPPLPPEDDVFTKNKTTVSDWEGSSRKQLPDCTNIRCPLSMLDHRVRFLINEVSDLDTAANHARLALNKRMNPEKAISTCNAIIGAMFAAGRSGDAFDLFHFFFNEYKMKPDIAACNLIIKSHCEEGRLDDALRLYNHLLGHPPSPNHKTYDLSTKALPGMYMNLIGGFLQQGNLDMAYQLGDDFKTNSFNNDGFTANGHVGRPCLEVLLKYGKKTQAWALFEYMLDNYDECIGLGDETVNLMLNECIKEGQFSDAVNILAKSKAKLKYYKVVS
ncbi:hypothetical protein DY000_02026720 [Brassica cretica]|uniref:Pentacotripeptide-repeat region of PRORP domain-containing protein n=1 Tax=Brassica cretica TaxID=69181 RepID=A0ABQ7EBZ5_BRACR|nr:hypothetical protein DY000_02026720 [Brassica cretica]